jgi:Exopolysaccharide biosynthesis protein related to N-acetylglucosamine-1-phosphodiester alpha-N-acetylglucosaminidase
MLAAWTTLKPYIMKKIFFLFSVIFCNTLFAQLHWVNVDSLYSPLPQGTHVYFTNDSLFDGKPNIAYYFMADLKNKHLDFAADTTFERRFTPTQYFERDAHPLLIVNTSFFEFTHNHNLNLVMNKGKILSYNQQTIPLKGKDTLKYAHVFISALGIDKKRNADVAWTFTDSSLKNVYATQNDFFAVKDSSKHFSLKDAEVLTTEVIVDPPPDYNPATELLQWKMQTAVGGGPVLLQNGEIKITNNEEMKFAGKAINDKHPRTAMGYTKDDKLIVMVIQGRFPKIAEGATLTQEAQMLKDLGCIEALNLDGGGSSCMLINGKQTIKPSDKEGQRPVPAVFLIKAK